MGYEYDIFLSYKRGKIREQWIHDIFRPLFDEQLEEARGGAKSKVFIDTVEIPAGVDWPQYLATALSKSRCMVAILSPSYFGSEWCMKEFNAMYKRQRELREKKILAAEHAVIVPFVKQGPLEAFPDFIDRIQLLDYSRFNKVGEAFRNSELYLEMQGKIETDAKTAATMIKHAPDWLPEFEKTEWLHGDKNRIDAKAFIQSQPTL